jgi:3-hydroxyisobutyrate dehydrogenase
VITIVTDSPDVEQVVLGGGDSPPAAIDGLVDGSVLIDMTTISPAVTRQLSEALALRGVAMLDAPVSGGDAGAIAGTLSIMVGGEAEVVQRCQPIFEAMGKTITHVGPIGAGQTVKLCNQVAIAGALTGVCEALTLAQNSDVDPGKMLDAISAGAAGSWQMSNLGPRMVDRDFAPGFMVKLLQKDLRLALTAGGDVGQPLPVTALVNQLFHNLEASGAGNEGTQALVRVVEGLGGTEVRRPA